ncbi:MAG: dolichol kinase, partial [Spirochaetia bacterium]|nr:dolichol kinase [Spirochaetia bacterium]
MAFIRISRPIPDSKFNVYRKAWHTLGLVVPAAFYLDLFSYVGRPGRGIGVAVLVLLTVLLVLVDVGRFTIPGANRLFMSLFGFLLKKEETRRFNATVPYFFANIVLFTYFTPVAATIGCVLLMVGDPFAAYVGLKFGRVRFWNGKSLEGLAAFALSGTVGCVLFLLLHSFIAGPNAALSISGVVWLKVIAVIVLTALAAAVAEFFSGNGFFGLFDDNLVVPLASVLGLLLFGTILGLPTEWVLDPM